MINFKQEDILESNSEAIINTVNTVGIMGKGIALQFKQKYPENFKDYKKACDNNELIVGKVFVTETNNMLNPKYIVNFPTKEHWKNPSRIQYIVDGLKDLKRFIIESKIRSITIPPLGTGNGGLDWNDVKNIIKKELNDIENVEIIVLEPSDKFYKKKEVLKKAKLTQARALILKLFQQYNILDFGLTLLEAQKLAYFLQRFGEPLKLTYSQNYYGTFAPELKHLLVTLEHNFISGFKSADAKPFDKLVLKNERMLEVDKYIIDNCSIEQKQRLQDVSKFIGGFEYPLGMEILSTVDFILTQHPETYNDLDKIIYYVQNWSKRKKELMKPEYISISYNRLKEYKEYLYKNTLISK